MSVDSKKQMKSALAKYAPQFGLTEIRFQSFQRVCTLFYFCFNFIIFIILFLINVIELLLLFSLLFIVIIVIYFYYNYYVIQINKLFPPCFHSLLCNINLYLNSKLDTKNNNQPRTQCMPSRPCSNLIQPLLMARFLGNLTSGVPMMPSLRILFFFFYSQFFIFIYYIFILLYYFVFVLFLFTKLCRRKIELLHKGLQRAVEHHQAIVRQGLSMIEKKSRKHNMNIT